MSTDYHTAQGDFSSIVYRLQPMVLSNFVMWLDLKVAEFKVYGQMLLDGENDINTASWFLRPGTTREVLPNAKQKERTMQTSTRSERLKRIASSTVTRPDSKQSRIEIGDDDEVVEIKSKNVLPHDTSGLMDNLNELQDQLASFFKSSGGTEAPKQPTVMHTTTSHKEVLQKKEQDETSSNIPSQKSLKMPNLPLTSDLPRTSESLTFSDSQNIEKSELAPHTQTDQSWTIESSCELSPQLQAPDMSHVIVSQSKDLASSNVHKQILSSSPSQSNSISSSSLSLKQSHPLSSTKHSSRHSTPVMSNSNIIVKKEPVDDEFENFECEQKFSPRTLDTTNEAVSNSEHSVIAESDVGLETGTETVTKSDGSMYFISPGNQEGQLSDDKTGALSSRPNLFDDTSVKAKSVAQSRSIGPFRCERCSFRCVCITDLRDHFTLFHNIPVAVCYMCEEVFGSEVQLKFHTRSVHHSGFSPLQCHYCGKQFTLQIHFTAHINRHKGIKPFKCEHCKQTFTYKDRMTRHKKTCGGLKGVTCKCPMCDKIYLDPKHLEDHIQGVHNNAPKYQCKLCGEQFVWRGCLLRHKNLKH